MRLTRRDLGTTSNCWSGLKTRPRQTQTALPLLHRRTRPHSPCSTSCWHQAFQILAVTALVSGHRDKADKLAAEYGRVAKEHLQLRELRCDRRQPRD